MNDEHNRRSYDGKIRLALSIAALVSALWGGVTWLNGYIVTNEELAKQRYYTDYHIANLRLEITTRMILNYEQDLEQNGALSIRDQRRYQDLLTMRRELAKEVENLAETF